MFELYTHDIVAATSSKGNQEKWYDAQVIAGTNWTPVRLKHCQKPSPALYWPTESVRSGVLRSPLPN